jgi:hypothetical protein
MGIYIHLNIMPHQIDPAQWERVYEESLELIKAYPFADEFEDRETYGCRWVYLDRTIERGIPFMNYQQGWHTFGDLQSMQTAESFALVRDLEYYRKRSRGNGNCDEILVSLMINHGIRDEVLQQLHVDDVRVFDNKTQGCPFHIPILAIACLIESRFPKQAVVFGNITLDEMESAVKWANSILNEPIGLSERADNDKLLSRIHNVLTDEVAVLEAWMELTLQSKSKKMADFIRSSFGHLYNMDELFIKDDRTERVFQRTLNLLQSMHEEGIFQYDYSKYKTNAISDFDDLVTWKKGETIHPSVMQFISKVKALIDQHMKENNELFKAFDSRTHKQKIEYLTSCKRYFYIRKQSWESIFDHLDDSEVIHAVMVIMTLNTREYHVNKVRKALINNLDLLKELLQQ